MRSQARRSTFNRPKKHRSRQALWRSRIPHAPRPKPVKLDAAVLDAMSIEVAAWADRYRWTAAERVIFELYAIGLTRREIQHVREVTYATLKKQVQMVLRKSGDPSLDKAIMRLCRTMLTKR